MVISKKEGYLNFINYPFILMYGNFFYRNIDGEYSPAEIGLAKFTFADGLDGKNRFQIFVDPGKCFSPIISFTFMSRKNPFLNQFVRWDRSSRNGLSC